jgi:hypothetical protein
LYNYKKNNFKYIDLIITQIYTYNDAKFATSDFCCNEYNKSNPDAVRERKDPASYKINIYNNNPTLAFQFL